MRIRRNVSSLYGKPDIALKKYKIVIFIDSCFWHSCELHRAVPKTNNDYWTRKLARNKARDQEVTQYYENNNWRIMRVWEHDLMKDSFSNTVDTIEKYIRKSKEESN